MVMTVLLALRAPISQAQDNENASLVPQASINLSLDKANVLTAHPVAIKAKKGKPTAFLALQVLLNRLPGKRGAYPV